MFGGEINDMPKFLLAIESLHNFTLIHDDVMDNAVLRRGSETINKKWSNNQAILSVDVLLMKSYQYLLESKIVTKQVLKDFTDTAILICEGQQMDFDLQFNKTLTREKYFKMIQLKTGVLIDGIGSDTLHVKGINNNHMHDIDYTIIPDRIEAGTFMIACAMCGGVVTINNVNVNHLDIVIDKLIQYAINYCNDFIVPNKKYLCRTIPKKPNTVLI